MLQKTFCHIPGISLNVEKMLWESGITSWDLFFEKWDSVDIPKTKIEKIKEELPLSRQAFERKDIFYFRDLLHAKEHWRLASMGRIAFVDIETTGISRWDNQITLIGIYDGNTPHIYIQGQNLADADQKLKSFDLLVTFNGKQFDLPFIEEHFQTSYPAVHLDLRYMLRELGLQGGLKSIERQLGISRDDDVAAIDGFEAVRLWRRYQRGDKEALRLLVKYNQDDIVNLKTLLEYYLQKKQSSI